MIYIIFILFCIICLSAIEFTLNKECQISNNLLNNALIQIRKLFSLINVVSVIVFFTIPWNYLILAYFRKNNIYSHPIIHHFIEKNDYIVLMIFIGGSISMGICVLKTILKINKLLQEYFKR